VVSATELPAQSPVGDARADRQSRARVRTRREWEACHQRYRRLNRHRSRRYLLTAHGPEVNSSFTGQTAVSVDKATVYEIEEPNPGGGAGSGNANGPPAYAPRVAQLTQSYTGETQIDSCLTASAASPEAITPNGYLELAVTIGLTTPGTRNNTYGTNYVQFGRVTTTYSP
jgi:hypothetical protein